MNYRQCQRYLDLHHAGYDHSLKLAMEFKDEDDS
jgi:hypothetical protein